MSQRYALSDPSPKIYRTISRVQGPLLVVERTEGVAFEEMVEIIAPGGEARKGRVLEAHENRAVIQVYEGTDGLDVGQTSVRFLGRTATFGVAPDILGRILGGSGQPIDGGPPLIAKERRDINGRPINPYARAHPRQFVETGISVIDGMNTLARGQKLPIFYSTGLPANRLAAQIADQSTVEEGGADGGFAVVFAAIGINQREAAYFESYFEGSGQLERSLIFLNRADDPTIERVLTPRLALTAAEYLAFEQGRHVLVIMTDMVNYCEALREIAAAREEVPGRRGYPAYMYSDLASLYERVGRLRGQDGSVTQLVMVTLPDDDMTHPIPDLTGYITEGQIVLNQELHQRGIYPPIDVLPSLSRLMKDAIGEESTREDHRELSDQLYALYADGRDLRQLASIIGEGALSEQDRKTLEFADRFEREFTHQGADYRSLEETLNLGWELLRTMPRRELKRVSAELLRKYYDGADKEGSD
ncbi:MAG: V-type ATP synthase subunit B [Anaerolineales bacterium]